MRVDVAFAAEPKAEVAVKGKANPPVVQDCVVTLPEAEIVKHCPAWVERLVMARDVEVALVRSAEVAPRLVEVAFVKEKFVPLIAVVDAPVIEALVMMALVAPKLVVVALVAKRLPKVPAVDDA